MFVILQVLQLEVFIISLKKSKGAFTARYAGEIEEALARGCPNGIIRKGNILGVIKSGEKLKLAGREQDCLLPAAC
jgi:hypothetical protein